MLERFPPTEDPVRERDDRRPTERINILGELRGEVMMPQPVSVREISRSGAQVESAFALPLNSLHDFRLALGERSIVVKARVVHASIVDVDQELVLYRSGVEFIDPSERVREAIAQFIDALRAARIPS